MKGLPLLPSAILENILPRSGVAANVSALLFVLTAFLLNVVDL
jgi:hypothetical protein